MNRLCRIGILRRLGLGCGSSVAVKRFSEEAKLLCGNESRRYLLGSSGASFWEGSDFPRNRRWFCTNLDLASEAGIVEVPLAQTGEGIADCELLKWFVQEGDYVEEFQPLCEVQSDKATIEITSRYKGKVSKVNFMPGAIVKVGEILLEIISTDGTRAPASEEKKIEVKSSGESKVLTTPAIRSLAKQLGINLEGVAGSGKDGRILKDDVLKLASVKERMEEEITGISAPRKSLDEDVENVPCTSTSIQPDDDAGNLEATSSSDESDDEIIPVRGFRRTMAKTMTAASAVPHFHYMEEINMDALVKIRAALQTQTGCKLTYLPFLIKALSLTLQKYPILNSNVNKDATEIRCKAWHNIGVAMATSSGLAVPNIKRVQKLSVQEIAEEIWRLSNLAAENKLSLEDVSNGTITVSNFGAIGGKFGSPILNLPEAAILGVGRIQKLPRFNEHGNVYPASIMNVTWGADHRVIDGATIAKFCNEWKCLVECPEQWLLHLK